VRGRETERGREGERERGREGESEVICVQYKVVFTASPWQVETLVCVHTHRHTDTDPDTHRHTQTHAHTHKDTFTYIHKKDNPWYIYYID
jgi:hypothetical protein